MSLNVSWDTMPTIKREDLTQDFLREVLDYNPESGWLTWKSKKYSKRVKRGARAGMLKNTGYRVIKVFGVSYQEHHLIWFWVNGVWATDQIDHINQERSDNRIANLRQVTKAENARNRGLLDSNTSGYQGIWFDYSKGKWKAEITLDGRKIYQKHFNDIEEAAEAREAKLLEFGFHINHGQRKK